MKKITIISLVVLLSSFLLSCECDKEKLTPADFIEFDLAESKASFELSEAGFDITKDQLVSDAADGQYTSGIIEYHKNGQVLATVNFGDGTDKDKASCTKDGDKFEIDLKEKESADDKDDKDGKYDKGKCHNGKEGNKLEEIDFEKVLIEPLVKATNCDFIVSGIIKYYDSATGAWLATVDFGDGTCDDIATKTTPTGNSTFTVSDYF